MYDASEYVAGYEMGKEDKASGIIATRACGECHALLTGKHRVECPRCDGVIVTLSNSASLLAQGYLDATLGLEPVFSKGTIVMRNLIVLAAVLLFSGPAFAQGGPITISPNTGAGDDSSEVTVDLHSETTSETDNSTTTGDVFSTTTHEGQSDRHAERAPASVAFSSPQDGPCGDSTGLGAQGGNVGVSLATVSEACRAARVSALINREDVAPGFKVAVQITYWAGYLPRLLLHVATAGVLG